MAYYSVTVEQDVDLHLTHAEMMDMMMEEMSRREFREFIVEAIDRGYRSSKLDMAGLRAIREVVDDWLPRTDRARHER